MTSVRHLTNYLPIAKLVIKVNIQKLVQVTASRPSCKVWVVLLLFQRSSVYYLW